MVWLGYHQFKRVLDGDKALIHRDRADQGFRHGGFAGPGGAAEQDGQPGFNTAFEKSP